MVALRSSRGIETPSSKLLMRWSVVFSDLLFFVPAACALVRSLHGARGALPIPGPARAWALAALLLQPALLLIDHGHFQYNGISLGLSLGAAAAVAADRDLLGSALFVAAINHKQMSLFYAPAFFSFLLGKCLRRSTGTTKSKKRAPRAAVTPAAVLGVARLGVTVVAAFALCWLPFLAPPRLAAAVAARLVPLRRGLFEDHVANFWRARSPPPQQLAQLAHPPPASLSRPPLRTRC